MGLFEHNIKPFPETLRWVKEQDVSTLNHFLTDEDGKNRLFLASGSLYSAAAFAELMSADRGIMAHALTPFFFLPEHSTGGENPRDERMVDIAKEHGYHMSGETTYMISRLLDQAGHNVVMSESHRNEVTKVLCYAHWTRIDTFRTMSS